VGFCFVLQYSSFHKERERNPMTAKRITQTLILIAILVTSFASTGGAYAWTGCSTYITVQWGDTLSGIASLCGTSLAAIQAANPGLGSWVYAGQVLYIPSGYSYTPVYYEPVSYSSPGGTYVVQSGDTLGKIAGRMGISVYDILAVNPQIWNASLIYSGQVISLPAAAPAYYTIQSGDTLRNIASSYGTSVYNIQLLNPQIYNPNWIYSGQVIRVR
jgi:LysM repeat protein